MATARGRVRHAGGEAEAMPERRRRTVIIFARLPVEGKVKTRLAKTLGSASAATDFYKACAEHAFRQASRCAAAATADMLLLMHPEPCDEKQRWHSTRCMTLSEYEIDAHLQMHGRDAVRLPCRRGGGGGCEGLGGKLRPGAECCAHQGSRPVMQQTQMHEQEVHCWQQNGPNVCLQ